MAGKRKSFHAPPPVVVATAPALDGETSLVIHLPENPAILRIINLTPWIGRGIDDWVWGCATQLRAFLQGGGVTTATVVKYWNNGLRWFFEYLVSASSPPKPGELNRRKLDQFVAWLNDRSKRNSSSKRGVYTATKAILVALVERGIIPADRDLFPPNPFPGSNASMKGQSPLSSTERASLGNALRKDLIAIHIGEFTGTESEALTVFVLALAMRTGMNPAPLLEMGRDCLAPHPFMPNMMVLKSLKRRGNATHLKSLRYSRQEDDMVSTPMDGVGLLNKVLERSQNLAGKAPKHLSNRVWLYASEDRRNPGTIRCMTNPAVLANIQKIAERHGLRNDSGEPLRLNLSRLRKTMENRLWLLSNGDLFTVAMLMGHTPQVADLHYLACTDEIRRNATFVGEALPDIYRNGGDGETGIAVPIHKLENTPVGSCKDSLNGDKAPKDGTHCADFLSCFSCRSYAIVGSHKDLHRLFSFYWFLETESQRIRSRKWTEQFRWTMNLIDTFAQDKFDQTLVAEAKETARINPINFWKSYQVQGSGSHAQ